jgi:S-formylglutathione hydrolase FrmB
MMKHPLKNFAAALFLFACLQKANAAIVDTVDTYSPSMKKTIKAVVITPDDYANAQALPVVYLLNGYSGNYRSWIAGAKNIETAVDLNQIIIVCPDGNNSWYWDSPVDPNYKYETYVSTELVKWVDSKYKTIKDKKGRGITGLSMGGHGGLYLAIKHPDVFGAGGSMSGGVDIRPFPNNWDMSLRLGKYDEHPDNWEKYTVINLLHLIKPNSLALIIDCGTEDFFFKVNENLHQQMLYRNIAHDYITRPGAHNWNYWVNAVQYQLLFMSNFFKSQPK